MKRKSDPLISVIIPAYNAETTIERSVLSALNQKIDASLEVIVVNDCSSDSTSTVLDGLSQTERGLKVIHHEENRGVAAARNSAIEVARGDWVVFLDADDYFGDQYLHDVEPHLKDCKFVATSYTEVRDSGFNEKSHRLSGVYPLNERNLLTYMEDYFWKPYNYTLLMHCWNKFFRRDIIETHHLRFDERLSQLEDVHFVCSYLRESRSGTFVDAPQVFHVVSGKGGNLSFVSGAGGLGAISNFLLALDAVRKLKQELLTDCEERERVSFSHFISSMAIIFCLRIARRIRRRPSWILLRQLYLWCSNKNLKTHFSSFRQVEDESKFTHFAVRKTMPAMMFVAILTSGK